MSNEKGGSSSPMISLLTLQDGRGVYVDGQEISQQDALVIARSLVETWGSLHPKAKVRLLVEVQPKSYSDCPHYDTLEEGLVGEGYERREG